MTLSEAGLAHIKHFEGLRLKAYVCPGGELSIGFGHTGKDVTPGMTINEDGANLFLKDDVKEAEDWVNQLVTHELTQGQFDACVDFVYNLGVGSFKSSTLLRLINAGLMDRAADEFLRWIYADGKPLTGLIARREAARTLFLS